MKEILFDSWAKSYEKDLKKYNRNKDAKKIEWDVIKPPLKSEGLDFTEVSVYDYLFRKRF